jgi:hypothetical protein
MQIQPEQNPSPAKRSAVWLACAHRADNDGLYLRLMIVNPLNGEICPMLETSVEPDTHIGAPGPSDLHIGTL